MTKFSFSEKATIKSNPPSEMTRQEELSHKHLLMHIKNIDKTMKGLDTVESL